MNRFRNWLAIALIASTSLAGEAVPNQSPKGSPDRECIARLIKLHAATMEFTKKHGGKLPNLKTIEAAKKDLKPFVKDSKIWICPVLKKSFACLAENSGKDLKSIKVANGTPLYYDTDRHPDGKMSIIYVYGNCYRGYKRDN